MHVCVLLYFCAHVFSLTFLLKCVFAYIFVHMYIRLHFFRVCACVRMFILCACVFAYIFVQVFVHLYFCARLLAYIFVHV